MSSLIDKFIENKIISPEEAFSVKKEMESTSKTLDQALIGIGIPEEKIVKIKKDFFSDIPFAEFDKNKTVPESVLNYIPEDSVKRYKIVPLGIDDGYLNVGMLDPGDMTANTILQFISSKAGMPYNIFLISQSHYDYILSSYSGVKGEVSKALGEYSSVQEREMQKLQKNEDKDINEADVIREDAPIAKIVTNIIKGAASQDASDIHIEVSDKNISVRYRIDGVLKKSLSLPKNIHRAVVARVKIMAFIKIDERRKPQDGRFSQRILGRKIDFRVSTFPTFYGEKVVMRLLEQDRGALAITDLGFTEENLEKINKAIAHTYGILLVCGPTGSGKTNTLYSLLNEIDKVEKNVVSLENPIELNVPGVSQSQVRPDIGYTFSTGLRSILRQDPDVIMVGEIRDEETAKLAIEASLTGHLVLSTIHTNTSYDVPQRLVDMGVEPYLIGPTLIVSIGQRLIRKIRPDAKQEREMTDEVKLFVQDRIKDLSTDIQKRFSGKKMYTTENVTKEGDNGLKGRIAVFEVLEMTDKIRRLILTDPSSLSIYSIARKNGFITFKEDGILKALAGVTTFDEVLKL